MNEKELNQMKPNSDTEIRPLAQIEADLTNLGKRIDQQQHENGSRIGRLQAELQLRIRELERENAIRVQQSEVEIQRLRAELRATAHREYFAKYGEWDWQVRKRYMELVGSLAHPWPYPKDLAGYYFELHNYIPRSPLSVTVLYREDCLRFVSLTQMVTPDKMEQCKLTPKIVDAFLLLKYLAKDETMKGRGFGISRSPETWKGDSTNRTYGSETGFDYEGYKFHLVQ